MLTARATANVVRENRCMLRVENSIKTTLSPDMEIAQLKKQHRFPNVDDPDRPQLGRGRSERAPSKPAIEGSRANL